MTKLRVSGHTLAEQEVLAEKFTAMVTDELTRVLEMFKALVKYQGLTAAGIPTTPEEVFAHWSATSEGVLADFTRDVYTSGSNAIAQKVAASHLVPMGSGVPGLPASYSASYVAKATNKMKNMAPAMWQNIQSELVIGTAKGESIDKLADRVAHAGSVSISRAELTARTEVVGASNYGSYDQASLLGGDEGVSKQWLATEDMRTRPDHRLADGQIVPLHSTFSVGGYSMLHPGDFTAPASEVCNCRCTIVYVFDDTMAPALCPGGGSDCVTDPDKLPAAPAPPALAPGSHAPAARVPAAPGPTALPPALSRDELVKVYQGVPDSVLNDVYDHVRTSIEDYDDDLATAIGGAFNLFEKSPGAAKLFTLSDSEIGQVLKIYADNSSLDVGWLDDVLGKVATPAPVPAASVAPGIMDVRGLSVISRPDTVNLVDSGTLGGTHGAKLLTDAKTGEKWVFKPYASADEEFGAKLDVSMARLQSRVGLPQPSTYTVRYNGHYGSLQSMHDAVDAFPGGTFDPLKLSSSDVLDIQQEQVFDWLISNNDAHSGNFLRMSNGHIVGIDKGQAYKYLSQDTSLDWKTSLHAPLPPNKPVYKTLWQAYADGKSVPLVDPSSGPLSDLIARVMGVSDDELKKLLRPYAEEALKAGKLAYGDLDKFYEAALKRKNDLAKDFQAMYDRANAERATHFAAGVGVPPTPATFVPSATGHLTTLPTSVTSYVKSQIYNGLDWKALDSGKGEDLWKAFQSVKDVNADAAGLTDLQMARIVDDVNGSVNAAQAAVQDYLNSPAGKKAVDDLAKSKVTPATPPAAGGTATVPSFGADGDISGIAPDAKLKIKGITLSDSTITSPNKAIWDTVLHIQNTWAGDTLNALQVLRTMDEQFAAYWGQPNAHWYETKMLKWAKTKPGKDYISTAGYTPKWGSIGKIKKPSSFAPPGTPKAAKVALGKPTPELDSLPKLTWNLQSSTTFDEISNSEALTLQNASAPWTAAEQRGLYVYSDSYYLDINPWLRGTNPHITESLKKSARDAQKGMRPSTRPMTLWRGTTAKQFGLGDNATAADLKKLIGKKMQDEGFFSTSVGSSAAFSYKPVLIQVEAPTGSQMAFIDHISANQGENEMLLAAGTKYEVLDVYEKGRQTVVRVRIIR
jgi:hypothetical protein